MAEFQWWLLLVGLVAGGGLVAVVFLDGARREQDIEEAELPAEASWIATRLGGGDERLDARQVEAVLREHREYRQMPPPDRLDQLRPRAPEETAEPEETAGPEETAEPEETAGPEEPAEPRPGSGTSAGTSSRAVGTSSRSARSSSRSARG